MADRIIQQLSIHLHGGQSIVVPFSAEKPDVLNPQVEAFFTALGKTEDRERNFLFQGARLVLVRLAEVSACEVVSLIQNDKPQS